MRILFAVLILSSFCTFSYSQIKLRGQVLDSATQQPLALSLLGINKQSIVSDAKGTFVFTALSVGNNTLMVSHVGCDIRQIDLVLTKDTFITIHLPHHDHTFEEVVAYGHLNEKEPDARLIQTISSKKLEQLAAVSLSDALQNTNGVSFLKTGSTIAKPIINGMHSNRISVINDDSKQEGQQWGSEHAPEIDPLSAGSIELIKGASTLRFGGDAMGGVIRVLPATFQDTSYTRISLIAKGETNPNGGQLGLKLENYNEKIALGQRLVLNGKRNGDGNAANYTLSNTGFGQLSGSYYAMLNKGKSKTSVNATAFVQRIGILATSHIGNLTDLNRALASDTPLILRPFTYTIQAPSQFIQHYSGKLKWEFDHDKLGELTASYTVQNNHRQEFDNHSKGTNAALDLNLLTQQLNLMVDNHFNHYRWQYGAMGEWQQNTFEGRYFIPNYLRYKTGAFAIVTLEKANYLVEAGLRYDWQNTSTYRYVKDELRPEKFNFSGVSANLSGWRKINEDFKMHFSGATRFRSPDINELFSNGLHHGSAALEFGDLSLKQERSYSLNTALNYNHNRLRIQVEPYFHYFQNYIYLQPSGEKQLSIRGAFPVFNYIQTDATYMGTDIDIRCRLSSNWIAEAQTALPYAKDVRNNIYLFGIPAQRISGRLKYTFAEMLSMQSGYWWIGSSYTARQNRIEAKEDFTDPPAAYFLLDSELGAQYKETPLHFSFGVKNILNTSYRDYMNRYRYYADDLGINIYIILNYIF
jgi:iron complex outermembrane receptor protein